MFRVEAVQKPRAYSPRTLKVMRGSSGDRFVTVTVGYLLFTWKKKKTEQDEENKKSHTQTHAHKPILTKSSPRTETACTTQIKKFNTTPLHLKPDHNRNNNNNNPRHSPRRLQDTEGGLERERARPSG